MLAAGPSNGHWARVIRRDMDAATISSADECTLICILASTREREWRGASAPSGWCQRESTFKNALYSVVRSYSIYPRSKGPKLRTEEIRGARGGLCSNSSGRLISTKTAICSRMHVWCGARGGPLQAHAAFGVELNHMAHYVRRYVVVLMILFKNSTHSIPGRRTQRAVCVTMVTYLHYKTQVAAYIV